MSFIFCDADTKQIIDIIEDRRLSSLQAYFKRYTKEARECVKHIVIDMYAPYMSLIKDLFHQAKIILDKFHLIQHLSLMHWTKLESDSWKSLNHMLANSNVIGVYF